MNEQLALDSPQEKTQVEGPADCLGMSFENDEKRRDHFLEKLREKLKDPEFRQIEGFPIGSDADILALSDPPSIPLAQIPFLKISSSTMAARMIQTFHTAANPLQ